MISEPIIFNYRTDNDPTIPDDLLDLPKVTLLVNPTTLSINWKKIITRVRTKSRIVSLNWGLEPINFSYTGQTGNLFPAAELSANTGAVNSDNQDTVNNLTQENLDLKAEADRILIDLNNPSISEDTRTTRQTEYDDIAITISINEDTISNLSGSNVTPASLLADSKHTEILELSPKYQRFLELQRLFEESKNITSLMKVQYRNYIFEGYFENFGFIDDGSQPWNRTYSISFTILNWDRQFSSNNSKEIVLI